MSHVCTSDIIKKKYSAKDSLKHYLERVDIGLDNFEKYIYYKYLKKNSRCLLIGCGAGREILPLAEAGFDIVGLDLVKDLVFSATRLAKEKDIKLNTLVGDTRNLMFKESVFDFVIFSWAVIQHLSQRQRIEVLAELKKILRKDGLLLLLVDNNNYYFEAKYSFWPLLDILKKTRKKVQNIDKKIIVSLKQKAKVILRPSLRLYFLMCFSVFTIYFPSFIVDLTRTLGKRMFGKFYNGPELGQRFLRKSFALTSLRGLPVYFYRFYDVRRDIKESNLRLIDYLSNWEIDKNLRLPYFLKIRSPKIAYIIQN